MNESWRNASSLLPTSSVSSNSTSWPPTSTSLITLSSTVSSLSSLGSPATAMPTSYYPGLPYEPWEMIIIALVAGSLSIITVLGNIMVILSFKIDKQLQTISNYYLFSLAVADFVIGFISMPLFTMYLLLDRWPLGPLVCDTWLALDYLASNASVLNLLIISFDRYFSVTRPLTYRARRTTKKAACMIASAWLISLALWPPLIYAWPHIEGERKVPEDKCFIQFVETNTAVTLVTAVAAFYLPVSVMIGLYYRIWRETEQRKKDLSFLQADNQQSRNTSKRSNSSDEVVNVIDHNNAAARANSDDDAADGHRLVANARGGLSLISESDRYGQGRRRGTGGSGTDDRRRRSRWDWMSDIFSRSNKHQTAGRQTAGGTATKVNKRRRKSTGGMADKKYRFSIPSLDEVTACTDLGSRMAAYYPPPVLPPLPVASQNRRQQSSSSSSSAARVNVTQGNRKSPHRRHHPHHHSQRNHSQAKHRNNPGSQPDQTQSAAESLTAGSGQQGGPGGSGQHRRSIHRAPARRCLSSDSVYTILIQLPAETPAHPFVAKLKTSDDHDDDDDDGVTAVLAAPRQKSRATCTTDDDDDEDVGVAKISVTSSKQPRGFERQPSIRMICEEPDIIFTRTPSTKSNPGEAAAGAANAITPAVNGLGKSRPKREETVESAADDDEDCCSSDENDEEEEVDDEADEESIRRKIPKGPYPPGSPIAALRGFLSDYSMRQPNPVAKIRAQTSQDSSGREGGPGSPTTSSSRRSSVFPASGASSTRNLVSRGAHNKGDKKADKKRRKNHERKQDSNRAARTLSAILGAFIFTWTPYNVLVLLKNLLKSEQEEDFIPKELWNFAYYLCYINSTVNPMCYALCNAAFRRTYVRILTCKWSVSRTRREAAAGVAAQAAAAAATAPQSSSANRSNC